MDTSLRTTPVAPLKNLDFSYFPAPSCILAEMGKCTVSRKL